MPNNFMNRLKAKKVNRKKKNIEYYFNKARMSHKEKFSFTKVRERLLDMVKLIDDDTIPNKHALFFEQFLDLYLLAYSDDHSGSAKIHPSSFMDACDRSVYYELTGASVTNEVSGIDVGLQKIFDIGTFWHTYLQAYLKKAGILKESEVIVRSRRKYIDGRADGVIEIETEERLLEIKTISTFGFNSLKEPLEHHKFQASLYASELGIRTIHFIYVEKNFGNFKEFVVRYDREYVQDANNRIKEIKGSIKISTPPKRYCDTIEDESAEKCPYKDRCFKIDINYE